MIASKLSAVADTAAGLRELARTTAQMRFGGRRSVARRTRRAMLVEPSDVRIEDLDPSFWRTLRSFQRASTIWPLKVACLQYALALQAVLARRGIDGRLRVGSRLEEGALEAHAWLDVGDLVIDEQRIQHGFTPFPQPGTATADEPGRRERAGPTTGDAP